MSQWQAFGEAGAATRGALAHRQGVALQMRAGAARVHGNRARSPGAPIGSAGQGDSARTRHAADGAVEFTETTTPRARASFRASQSAAAAGA
jgi:hypothetical protein